MQVSVMTKKDPDKLVLDSSFDEINRLEPFLREVQEKAGFDEDEFARIQLAVNEAVTNAIVHGNKEDRTKQVTVSASSDNRMVTVSVLDQGAGFDPSSLPDPLENENLLKDSGRGVFLIKQYADEVAFSEGGRKLTMQFNTA